MALRRSGDRLRDRRETTQLRVDYQSKTSRASFDIHLKSRNRWIFLRDFAVANRLNSITAIAGEEAI